jgi:hypothetical protein
LKRVVSTATPEWAVVVDPDEFPVSPVHATLTGDMTWVAARRRFEATIQGDAITAHLDETVVYAIVIWWGANLRKVLENVQVSVRRV